MNSYRYDKKAFGRSVTFTGVFCILVGLYSVAMLLSGNFLFWVVLLVCIYQAYNTFISMSNPEEITITEQSISFSAYGRTHEYKIDEVNSLRIKEISPYKKFYVRISTPATKEGRYWVNCGNMNDGRDLWDRFAWLEYQKDATQLKFRARTPTMPTEDKVLEDNS